MKKKALTLGMAVLSVLILIPTIAVYANQIRVTADGQPVDFAGQQPVIVDGRTLVPVRAVFEHLGFVVEWDTPTQTATITRGNDIILITIGSAEFTTNGDSHMFDVQAQIIGGSTMVPIRLPLESVGYNLNWDGTTNTVLITSGATGTTGATTQPAVTQATGQASTSNRIRQFHSSFFWIADTMDRWSDELGMTIDEIFDYTIAAGSSDLFIQTNADVSALVNRVSFDSLDSSINTRDFINIVSQAYTVTRLLNIVNGWADELGMTIDEIIAYSGDMSRLFNILGVEFDDFHNALTQVNTAFVSIAGHVGR